LHFIPLDNDLRSTLYMLGGVCRAKLSPRQILINLPELRVEIIIWKHETVDFSPAEYFGCGEARGVTLRATCPK
jgi:hypothetical protein